MQISNININSFFQHKQASDYRYKPQACYQSCPSNDSKKTIFTPIFAGSVNCDFLSKEEISLINNFIINKFGDISTYKLKEELAKEKNTNPTLTDEIFLSNIVPKCEFANIKDFDKVLSYIRENHMQLFITEDTDTSCSLAYLQTKRNPKDQIKTHKISLDNLAQKAHSLSKRNPAIILTKDSINSLQKMAQESPEAFNKVLLYTNFLYPKNSLNGINAFYLTGAEEIIQKGLTPKCDEEEINAFLKTCEENIKKFPETKIKKIKFHEIRNPLRYSLDSIANRLKYRHRFYEKHDDTFMPTARIMRQLQNNNGYNFFSNSTSKEFTDFRNSILKHTTLLTPIKLNLCLKELHEKITAKTKGNEVYYLPKFDKPKSFNYMLNSYFAINNIPKEKLIKDLSIVEPNQKVVLLDDYIGSGNTMLSQLQTLEKANIHKKNIIIASLVCTNRGLDTLLKSTPNIITGKIISQYDIKRTGVYTSSEQVDTRSKLRELSSDALIGGYNNGMDNFSTYYMSPNNNNNLFLSNIAPGFVISSHGIKTSFNTFDKTIQKSNLDDLSEKELNEIIEIYKKANAVIPKCIIEKIVDITPNNSDNLISVLNTYGKTTNPIITPKIEKYLKNALADIDIKKVNNSFVIDNIMTICDQINNGAPPIKFVTSMLYELQKPKTKVADDVLLHFYLKLIEQVSPMKDINAKIIDIIKNLKPEQIIKFNILEDILQIYNYHNLKLPKNISKRIYEVMDNIGEKNISLELFTLILKTPQIDEKKFDKEICRKWWNTIPDSKKENADQIVIDFFDNKIAEKEAYL